MLLSSKMDASSDKVHVISAWIAPSENIQREIINKIFFHDSKRNKGADLPKSSSYPLGHGQATFTTDKYDGKAHALNGHGTFRLPVLVV